MIKNCGAKSPYMPNEHGVYPYCIIGLNNNVHIGIAKRLKVVMASDTPYLYLVDSHTGSLEYTLSRTKTIYVNNCILYQNKTLVPYEVQ